MSLASAVQPTTDPNVPQAAQYKGYGATEDARRFLITRWQQTYNAHLPRIQLVDRMLALWLGDERALYGTARKRDDEERIRLSRPFKIIDIVSNLVWNKAPTLQISNVALQPEVASSNRKLETALTIMCEQYKIWRACRRAVFWTCAGGVCPLTYWYDQFAMDDEQLLVFREQDPRTSVWKESIKFDGSVDYFYSVADELALDVLRKWGLERFETAHLNERVLRDPTYKLKVYTYWAEERRLNQGMPTRQIIRAVFTDYGWLQEPQVMPGYTRVPVMLFRGADYPIEHMRQDMAYMPVLYPVEGELMAEARMKSGILTNAMFHMDPAVNITSSDVQAAQRIDPTRGAVNRLRPDEKVEEFRKPTTITPDTEAMALSLDQSIQGATIPQAFEGTGDTADLSQMSGVSMSMMSTIPVLRVAVRQQYIEDTLEKLIPAAVTCLARHAIETNRVLRFAGRDPRDQQQFLEMTVDPVELLDPDLRMVVKLSSSLPRDSMNEATMMMNAQRMGILDKYTTRSHLLKLFDLGVTDPDEIERRISYEMMQDVINQQRAQQLMMQGQMGMSNDATFQQQPQLGQGMPPEEAPSGIDMFSGQGEENVIPEYGQQAYQQDVNNTGPMESMVSPRQPGMRMPTEVADTFTGYGQNPVEDPMLAQRRNAAQFVSRNGALQEPFQPRREY